jgi:ligand-binding SRPBCC domain-containing protein
MKIVLKTKVEGHFKSVFNDFDLELFEYLKPSIGKMEIVEFGGSTVGSKVHMRFLSPIKADWISNITDRQIGEKQAFFIDEGVTLPPGMSYWHHKHIVRYVSENESEIIDDITYRGNNFILSVLLYPGLLIGFLPRIGQYKRFFRNRLSN